jgi:hypothetical protein
MADRSEIVFSTERNMGQHVIARAEIVLCNCLEKGGVKSGDNREHGPLPGLIETPRFDLISCFILAHRLGLSRQQRRL